VDDHHLLGADTGPERQHLLQLVGIGGTHREHHRGRLAHRVGAGERRKEQHAGLVSLRHRIQAQGGRGVAEQSDGTVGGQQLLGVGARRLAVVGVIQRHQLDRLAANAAAGIDRLEPGQGTVPDVLAEGGVAAGQRRGLAHDPGVLGLRQRCTRQDRQNAHPFQDLRFHPVLRFLTRHRDGL
jgi:hypothetical protein